MEPLSLLRLSCDIRQQIFGQYLAPNSISIALLKQTCRQIYCEITTNVATHGPIDPFQLDGSSLQTIESTMGEVRPDNTEAVEWNGIFLNALSLKRLDDMMLLLDKSANPAHGLFACSGLICSGKKSRWVYYNDMAQMLSAYDAETITLFYRRLPCGCARLSFVCAAIRNCLYHVIRACPEYTFLLGDPQDSFLLRDGTTYEHLFCITVRQRDDAAGCRYLGQLLGHAIGTAGNIEMLQIIYKLPFVNYFIIEFNHYCIRAAAAANRYNMIEYMGKDERSKVYAALYPSIKHGHQKIMQYASGDYDLPTTDLMHLLHHASVKGDSNTFQKLSKMGQIDFSDVHWPLGNVYWPVRLGSAATRSNQDFAFFLSLCVKEFPSEIKNLADNLAIYAEGSSSTQPMMASALDEFFGIGMRNLSTSRVMFIVEELIQVAGFSPRHLYICVLWHMLKRVHFERELADIIVDRLMRLLVHDPLTPAQHVEMSRLALTDKAFLWSQTLFPCTISPECATSFLNLIDSTWRVRASLTFLKPYFLRCLQFGASLTYGVCRIVDLLGILYGPPFLPNDTIYDDPEYLPKLFLGLVLVGSVDPIVKLLTGVDENLRWVRILKKVLVENVTIPEVKRLNDGCIHYTSKSDYCLLSTSGRIRFHHQVCKLLGLEVTAFSLPK